MHACGRLASKSLIGLSLALSLWFTGLCAPASSPVLALPVAAAAGCDPLDNLGETADSFISRCLKGRIRSEFPSECLSLTLQQIRSRTDAVGRKCWKLISRVTYRKDNRQISTTPAYQSLAWDMSDGSDSTAQWVVTIQRDPQYTEELVFEPNWGWNTQPSQRFTVSSGTGTQQFTISQYYDGCWGCYGGWNNVEFYPTMRIAEPATSAIGVSDGDPVTYRVHWC